MSLYLDDTHLETCYLDHPYIQVITSTLLVFLNKVLIGVPYILVSFLFSDRPVITVLSYRTISSIDEFEARKDNYLEAVKANSD